MQYMHATLADCTAVSLYLKQSNLDRFDHTYKSVISPNSFVTLAHSPAARATVNAAPCLAVSGAAAQTMRLVGDNKPGSVHAEI